MRYRSAVNVYEGDILSRLISGELVLQVGQWIRCGAGPCSRWCGVTNAGTLVAAHPKGAGGVSASRFRENLDYLRRRQG